MTMRTAGDAESEGVLLSQLKPHDRGAALGHMLIECLRESGHFPVDHSSAKNMAATIKDFADSASPLNCTEMFTGVPSEYKRFGATISRGVNISNRENGLPKNPVLFWGLKNVLNQDDAWYRQGLDPERASEFTRIITPLGALKILFSAPTHIKALKLRPVRNEQDPDNIVISYPTVSLTSGLKLPTDEVYIFGMRRYVLPAEILDRRAVPLDDIKTRADAENLINEISSATGHHSSAFPSRSEAVLQAADRLERSREGKDGGKDDWFYPPELF